MKAKLLKMQQKPLVSFRNLVRLIERRVLVLAVASLAFARFTCDFLLSYVEPLKMYLKCSIAQQHLLMMSFQSHCIFKDFLSLLA